MKAYILFFTALFISFAAKAQLVENFSDGNFNTNPLWSGDTLEFKISTSTSFPSSMKPGLQLNGTAADTSALYTSCVMGDLDNKEWNCWVRLSFNTSHSNNLRIYIVSDDGNFNAGVNGYFVLFGDDADDQADRISLWKQSGASESLIVDGTIANTGKTGSYRIRVTRNGSGLWTLYSDTTGNRNFRKEGEGFDDSYSASFFYGFLCKYTSSNKTNFYFDDIYAGPLIIDTVAPHPLMADVLSASKVDVLFSEPLESMAACDNSNYLLSEPAVNPSVVSQDAGNPSLIHLTFPVSFRPELPTTVYFHGLGDCSENINPADSITFIYYKAYANDVIVSEIMADPSPVVGLPESEFLELFNRKGFPLSITGWTLRLGAACRDIPMAVIPAGGYVILCSDSSALQLSQFGQTVPVSGFSLVNSGETITLQDRQGTMINTLTYTDKWYNDNARDEGGWSMEIMDEDNPCGGIDNWRASLSPEGGTPGVVNSVNTTRPDNERPFVLRTGVVDTLNIMVYFSEQMDSASLANPAAYELNNGIGNPVAVQPCFPDYRQVKIHLVQPLLKGLTYNLSITATMTDCAGNIAEETGTIKVAVPDTLEPGDVVISEILSNPMDDGVDFIEIYNRSQKVIDLNSIKLASAADDVIETVLPLTEMSMLLFPGEYLALTADVRTVKKQYFAPVQEAFLQMYDFPSFNDDEGTVLLTDKGLQEIDKVHYTAAMHFPLLVSTDGVSLERLDQDRNSLDASNWHSASETAGFATPGYKNSQSLPVVAACDPVTISPGIFSPDNDGYNDVLTIAYKFDQPGFMANAMVFDDKGRLVRRLVHNELLGTEAYFTWDGINSNGQKANIGIYIIYFEVFNKDGKVKRYKKTAVLGGKI